MIINLIKNKGYNWCSRNEVHFKGYFFVGNEIFRNERATDFFKKIQTEEEFTKALKEINGIFAVIINKEDKSMAAVDRARSFPIYFSHDYKHLSDSSEWLRKNLDIAKDDVDELALFEFLANSYLMFNKTIYSGIKQLNLGQYLIIENGIGRIQYYYRHLNDIQVIDKEEAKKQIRNTAEEAFERLKKAINNRPVVLSLSGGYDSRLVACMLKEVGIEDVSCYTYGRMDSYEIQISKNVAEKLGYRWKCIEYSDEMIKSLFNEGYTDYFKDFSEHDYILYLQNVIAVKELSKEKWFKEDSVFITGLCGDLPSGEYVIRPENASDLIINNKSLAEKFYDNHYTFVYNAADDKREKFITEILFDLELMNMEVVDLQSFVSAYDCIETGSVHSKAYLNANRAHEYIDAEWLIPLWDNKWLDLWYSLPMEYRVSQNLYEEWLLEDLFEKYDVAIKKERVFSQPYSVRKKQLKTKIKYFVGGLIARLFFMLHIPFRRKTDYNNFAVGAVECYKRIKNKKIINYKRGNFNTLLTILISELRYTEIKTSIVKLSYSIKI